MSKTIAILRTGGVGDVILSTVAINTINDLAPGCRILWFGREPVNSLIREAYPDVEVHELTAGNSYTRNLRLIGEAAKEVHAVMDLQRSARTMILGCLSALRFGCSYTSWNKYSIARGLLVLEARLRGRRFKFSVFERELTNRYEAMQHCCLRALAKMKIRQDDTVSQVPGFSKFHRAKEEGSVAICLGAKFEAKALPAVIVEKIMDAILSDSSVKKVYFLGEGNQSELADKLLKVTRADVEGVNLCGSTTLTEAAGILSQCRYALVNDSGLAHLAEAVNTPVLMFFGPTHEKFGYRPYLAGSRTFSADLGCRPCNKSGDTVCRYGDHACATQLKDTMLTELINHMQYV